MVILSEVRLPGTKLHWNGETKRGMRFDSTYLNLSQNFICHITQTDRSELGTKLRMVDFENQTNHCFPYLLGDSSNSKHIHNK